MKYELEGCEMKKYGGSWRDSDGVILKEEHYAFGAYKCCLASKLRVRGRLLIIIHHLTSPFSYK